MQESMTPRERWLAVLQRETPDRVPMDIWATPEAMDSVMRHLGAEDEFDLYRKLRIDRPFSVSPRYVGPTVPANSDVYGIEYRDVDYGSGTYREAVTKPLAQFNTVTEIEANYSWPDPAWWDYSDIAQQIIGHEDYPIRGGGSEPFLIYKNLRGQEQAFMDMVLYPDIVHYCLDKMFELARIDTERIYAAIPGKVMISYVAEDMGGQEALMTSPKLLHEFIIPRMKMMNDLVHSAGAHVMYHSDGSIRDILPDMIEIGIDVLNPIQWRCKGMEREPLKRDFGDQVIFHGGVDNQYTLAFGSVDEVKQEVADDLRILGEGGGYILAPCHNIQPVSPPENIVAMYETGLELGWT